MTRADLDALTTAAAAALDTAARAPSDAAKVRAALDLAALKQLCEPIVRLAEMQSAAATVEAEVALAAATQSVTVAEIWRRRQAGLNDDGTSNP